MTGEDGASGGALADRGGGGAGHGLKERPGRSVVVRNQSREQQRRRRRRQQAASSSGEKEKTRIRRTRRRVNEGTLRIPFTRPAPVGTGARWGTEEEID